jgi:hypothetical protein
MRFGVPEINFELKKNNALNSERHKKKKKPNKEAHFSP